MQPLKVFSVIPRLPENLHGLWELAYNLWFSWNGEIESLFAHIDQTLWRETEKNPVRFLNKLPQGTLRELARDDFYIQRLNEAVLKARNYLSRPSSPMFKEASQVNPALVYFSFEFGISSCLPIYSGGLGILAGDHLKSASDLNIPLVGVGLAYKQGYFRQYLTPDGWQQERYPDYDFEQMPIQRALTPEGQPACFMLDVGGRPLEVQIWKAQIGRITLYLLDTNTAHNPPEFKALTSRLYGGDLEMRIQQEILLGIGGMRALEVLDLFPKVIHMNEGHSAFAGLQRLRSFMQQGLSFEAAQEVAASSSIFTTHTPVPAGNDRFPMEMMRRYFEGYAQEIGLAFKVFMALGRENPFNDNEDFCMTVLALKLSRFSNGVSKLHGYVSRNMWKQVWTQYPVEDVPIGAVTNGVHAPTWVAEDIGQLNDRYLGPNWREDPDCTRTWGQAMNIPDAELWRTHERLRARLIDFARMRLRKQLEAQGARRKELQHADEVLNPEALTIGFARRFATYKRANLLLKEQDKLLRLIADKKRPIQFIFAGKAHPADNGGKQLIKDLITLCRSQECRFNMVFIEDYDMEVAQHMISGCDVWLNNPRRPLEACGTSGMKAMLNGVLQFSTLDGWWDEAYKPDNSLGWAIGKGEEYSDPDYQDFVEIQTLYNVLENEIVPEFYDRGHGGLPRAWIRRMKQAFVELGPVFNSHRMVTNYVHQTYVPAYENYLRLSENGFAAARELAAWRMDMMTKWSSVEIRNVQTADAPNLYVNEKLVIEADIHLNGLPPEHILVESYFGPIKQDGSFASREIAPMTPVPDRENVQDGWVRYRGEATPPEAGRFGYTVRAVPAHPHLLDPHSLGLIRWAQP
jgi:starch phosphorylase